MSEKIETGGPAFPCHPEIIPQKDLDFAGMTLRQYAAIKLRVPNSGTDWLDEMIREARRDELAARAMQSYFQTQGGRTSEYALKWTAEKALEMADAMVKEMEVK